MKPAVRNAFRAELQLAAEAETAGDAARAWHHLERAHVLSQAYALPHVISHVRMLVHAWRRRDAREVSGQLIRIVVAGPGSWLGRAPLGNTGGANVGLLTPMPLPEDLRSILSD
jgi:hypothetical protein